MTKRELIDALEHLDVPDSTPVMERTYLPGEGWILCGAEPLVFVDGFGHELEYIRVEGNPNDRGPEL